MLSSMNKGVKYFLALIATFPLSLHSAWAGGPPEPSIFNNTIAIVLIILMILLVIVIGILANILVGAADMRRKIIETEKANATSAVMMLLFFLLPGSTLFAQDIAPEKVIESAQTIGGLAKSTFNLMITVIILELVLIIVMLINIKLLIQTGSEKLIIIADAKAVKSRWKIASWWDKINKFRPVSQEAELDLGHEYDGIRELNNKLPPWWLYGFYLTIVFAGIYLWRFHVSHNAPSSKQEYENAVAKADLKIKEHLKAKGEAVDENTVTLMLAKEDLEDGKAIFMKSCASCHLESGGGNVGPNLTDDFWMNGNDIKSVFKIIRYGINAMPQWQNTYSNKELAKVASYVKSLHGTNPPNAKTPQGIEMKEEGALPTPTNDSVKTNDGKISMNYKKPS